jgi:cytochrome c oxidase subunit 2
MHAIVLWVSIILILILAAIFLSVVRSSTGSASAESVGKTANMIRQLSFWGALVFGVALLYITLRPWPHALPPSDEAITVAVVGSQWSFEVDTETVPTGKPIVFALTSTDVNHGVGLYDENYVLLNQAQSMPGYTNRFEYTFDKPGTYRLLCLEYCGLGHHEMAGEITVTSSTASAEMGRN